MKNKKWILPLIALIVLAAGLVLTLTTRSAALDADSTYKAARSEKKACSQTLDEARESGDADRIAQAEEALALAKDAEEQANAVWLPRVMPFAVGLILTVLGAVSLLTAVLPRRHETNVRTLTLAALFAALCYIGFTFFKIDIPVGTEKTAFHLGNVFCVLAALLIGGFWGGMAGAVGMTIADLTTAYVTSAPKTFLLKLCIGLIVGLVAHKCFHITKESSKGKIVTAAVVSSAAGMAFNVVADPLVGFFYKTWILGVPQEAAKIWAKMGAVTTLVNAVVAVVAATVLYLALRPALKRTNLLPKY